MYKKISFFFLLPIIILCILLTPFALNLNRINVLFAETTINYQEITEDIVWGVSDSPYLLYYDNLIIREGASLTINPGVIVKIGQMSIYVEGNLNVIGTEENPVIFTSTNDDSIGGKSVSWSSGEPNSGDWGTIVARGNGIINMDYVKVKYGGQEYSASIGKNKIFQKNTALAQFYSDIGAVKCSGQKLNINHSDIILNTIGIQSELNCITTIVNSKIYENKLYGVINYGLVVVNAINNWWGDDSGPYHANLNLEGDGDLISDNIFFDPWIGKGEHKVNPVIIIPGIMSSYLTHYDDVNIEVWPSISRMIIDPWDLHLDELTMTEQGKPDLEKPLLNPIDIFRNIFTNDFFQGLITELENNGYEEGENLFVFPYDWRWDINWVAGDDPYTQIKSLKEKIEEIKSQTGVDKIDIIAHSMGGLVAKKYMKYYGSSSVDKFIDIATPHLGSPKAFKILMYGDDMGFNFLGVGLNSQKVYSISQNMPSIYQLLPSRNYFNQEDQNYAYYIYDMHDLDENGVKNRLNYDQSMEFMANTGRNQYLLEFNNSLHNDIDNYSPRSDDIKTYNIIGCGSPTIGQIFILNKEKSGKYEYGLKYISGDSTVPVHSAEFLDSDKEYYAKNINHAYLPSADGVRQLIFAILKDEENEFDFSLYENLKTDDNNCFFSGTQISFHSPIELHVYDEENNHLGPTGEGDIEMGILGAQYEIIEENKFVFLPSGRAYNIIGQAENTGNFNARIETIENGEYTQSIYYNEVPLANINTKIKLEINQDSGGYVIQLDQNGDGEYEAEILPSSVLEEDDLFKPETAINIIGEQDNSSHYLASTVIELIAEDNDNGSGILKTEYSLNRGLDWLRYQKPFVINDVGEYELWYYSIDQAGNSEEIKKQIITIVDDAQNKNIKSIILEINNLYKQGLITKKWIKNNLIIRLKIIKKRIEIYKYIKKSNHFDKIHNRLIKKSLKNILKSIELYYKKSWVNDTAYDIIKSDIKCLINNL